MVDRGRTRGGRPIDDHDRDDEPDAGKKRECDLGERRRPSHG
jgi:hypothetical protein